MSFPYTYINCPCTDVSVPIGEDNASHASGDEEQERTFDPKSPRANYSLYPLDHLMYCEDCQQIRCPRCSMEEIVCWYCPGCLFEIPSGQIKGEGNRCQRNCFNCPKCFAPMTVNALEAQDHHRPTGPFILACGYCNWSSQEIGIQFDNLVHLSSQLSKIYNKALREPQSLSANRVQDPTIDLSKPENPDIVFTNLKTFLKSQLQDSTTDNSIFTVSGDIIYNSPSALARIMALYNVGSHGKKADQKHTSMRESSCLEEGLRVTLPTSDSEAISKLRAEDFTSTTSPAQRSEQRHQPCQFSSELRPIPMLLRTKRARRCRTCRHILVKPDPKVESTRYRIRLIASNYIPSVHVKPLQSSASSPSPATKLSLEAIPPLQACQFLLSLRNPLFDPVNVTLATPSRTPGRWRHKVTILCPQFEIGANADAWDEALGAGGKDQRSTKRFGDPKEEFVGPEGRMAEAGKVWEKGRNWVSVVVEIVCVDVHGGEGDDGDEDEDLLEIPVFVRLEWEEDAEKEKGGKDGGREKRELAYWVVLGIGRVGKLSR